MNEENLIKDAAKGCNILPSQVRELSDEDKKFCRQQLWDRESEQRQNKVNTIKPIETGTGGIAGFLQSEEVSGNGKICYYNVNGTTKAMNVNRWATCRSVERFKWNTYSSH